MRRAHVFATLVLFVLTALGPGRGGVAAQRDAPAPTLAVTEACVRAAAQRTDLVDAQVRRLCFASPSPTAPVDCYVEATRTLLLTDPQGVELCRCSATLQPIACFRELREAALLTEPEMLALCSPTSQRGLRSDCTPLP